jgi:hypothetical protein
MDRDALDIAVELFSWAYSETNKLKANKLYKLARKYQQIWEDRD